MKKSLLITLSVAVMLLAGVHASAQVLMRDTFQAFDWNRDVVSFGFGPAVRIHSETGKETMVTYGFNVGMDERVRYSEFFGISSGVEFGTYRKYTLPFQPVPAVPSVADDRMEMYLEIPVRIRLYIPFSRNVEVFCFGGFVPSLCLTSLSISDGEYVSDFEIGGDTSRVDVMAGGGLGVEIGERVGVTVGYDYGLMDHNSQDLVIWQISALKFSLSILF
jgi:opacity protein-like surface antigen